MTLQTGLDWIYAHVDYTGDDCLTWPLSTARGYGQVGFKGKVRKVHRFMCELAHGEPPTPQHEAAHSCGRGQKGCVNPRHLSWKTREENQQDRKLHGTSGLKRGQRRYKLSPEQVSAIRSLPAPVNRNAVAAEYGVDPSTIRMILKGETWVRPNARILSPEEALSIRRMKGQKRNAEIAAAFGTSEGAVRRIMCAQEAWGVKFTYEQTSKPHD